MKSALFFLIIGAILGAVGWQYYQRTQNPTIGQRVENAADKSRYAVVDAKDAVIAKGGEAKPKAETVKEELARTGEIVRSNAKTVGEHIDDARIVAVIKGKYVIEKSLSAFAISIDCHNGLVNLTGSVDSPELISRAVSLAAETSGVRNVNSQLVVKS